MVRKEECVKELEKRLRVFDVIDDEEAEQRYYHKICGIVWFLESIGIFEEDEALMWIDTCADASTNAWLRIHCGEGV